MAIDPTLVKILPTLKVVRGSGFMLINECDYDETCHKLFVEKEEPAKDDNKKEDETLAADKDAKQDTDKEPAKDAEKDAAAELKAPPARRRRAAAKKK